MERLLQYLDDLDDLLGVLALGAERLRRALGALLMVAISLGVPLICVLLALSRPPLALAFASLLSVGLLYHSAVSHKPTIPLRR